MHKLLHLTFIALISISFAQQTTVNVDIDGVNRTYIQYLPTGFDPGTETLPVIFCLHGIGDNAQNMSNIGLNVMADTARFIVIYPQGVANGFGQTAWNNGTFLSSSVDDDSFFNGMINLMINDNNANPARIYVCGFSMGAIMSYHLACSLNDRVAAIGVMSGAMSESDFTSCSPTYKTPVIHIHGNADGTVPYESGGLPTLKLANESFQFWRDAHSCSATADSTRYADVAADGLTFDRFVYQNCTPAGSAELIRVNGGDHTYFYEPLNDITEIQEIWRFFGQWSHANPATASLENFKPFVLEISPNPFSNELRITCNKNIKASLVDESGRVIKTLDLTIGENLINTSKLGKGIYHILYEGQTTKIVKL